MQIIITIANILTVLPCVMQIRLIILYPGVGMFTFAKDKQTARVAAEFYINAINVMKGAEAISVNILHCHDRKHLILNTGYWKKRNCNECQNQNH